MTTEVESGFRRQWRLYQRLLSIPDGETLADLSDRFEVSTKTITRDLATLRAVGLAVVESTEKFGLKRWRVEPDTTRMPKLQWDEAAAIYLGRRFMEPMAGSLFWEASQKAFAKLKSTFSSEALDYIHKISLTLFQTTIGVSDYTCRAELIDTLMTAVEDQVVARITYHSMGAEAPKDSDVHPLGFINHEGSLYFVAFAPVHGSIRHYKMDRLHGVEKTQCKFTPPMGFKLDAHLAPSFGIFHTDEPLKTVRIRFSPEAARYVQEHIWKKGQRFEKADDGSVICEFEVSGVKEVSAWVLSFGSRAEALEPAELREAIKHELRLLREVYA